MKDKICVFGMGSYYSAKKEFVENNYEIVAFIDNRVPCGEKEEHEGIIVLNPKDWLAKEEDSEIILMAADWYGMWEQLKGFSVPDERIVLACSIEPFYDRTEEILSANSVRIALEDDAISIYDESGKSIIKDEANFQDYLRELYLRTDPLIKVIKEMDVRPSSTRFGLERGKPIDRVYIEKFLEDNKESICGTVIEIGDDRYMQKYADRIENPTIMHVNGWGGMKGNLATGEGIVDNYADCLICTQTLQHIYDLQSCVENIYRLLKPGGTALITNGCIGEISLYDYNNWGEFWKFTDMTARKLFEERFDKEKVEVASYGNVKSAVAFLYGMSSEELPDDTFDYQDTQYPMIVTIKAEKPHKM